MIPGSLVNRVFETANRRIWFYRTDAAAIDMPPRVTPHWMRHTFGMHLMWTLMHDLIERDNRLTRLLREHDEPGLRAYGQSVMWPVQVVQELMRHRSLRTTWLYLYHLGELDHSVIASVDDLAEVFLAIIVVKAKKCIGPRLRPCGVGNAGSAATRSGQVGAGRRR